MFKRGGLAFETAAVAYGVGYALHQVWKRRSYLILAFVGAAIVKNISSGKWHF